MLHLPKARSKELLVVFVVPSRRRTDMMGGSFLSLAELFVHLMKKQNPALADNAETMVAMTFLDTKGPPHPNCVCPNPAMAPKTPSHGNTMPP
jgi:hypothetical protein